MTAALVWLGAAAPSLAGNIGYYAATFADADGATLSYCFILTHDNRLNPLDTGFRQSGSFTVAGVAVSGTYVTENDNLHLFGPISDDATISVSSPLVRGELGTDYYTVASTEASGKSPAGTVFDAGTVVSMKNVTSCGGT